MSAQGTRRGPSRRLQAVGESALPQTCTLWSFVASSGQRHRPLMAPCHAKVGGGKQNANPNPNRVLTQKENQKEGTLSGRVRAWACPQPGPADLRGGPRSSVTANSPSPPCSPKHNGTQTALWAKGFTRWVSTVQPQRGLIFCLVRLTWMVESHRGPNTLARTTLAVWRVDGVHLAQFLYREWNC